MRLATSHYHTAVIGCWRGHKRLHIAYIVYEYIAYRIYKYIAYMIYINAYI